MTRRRGRRCKKLLDDLKDRRGYPHLKEEALDGAMWRNRFGRGVGPVVRRITEWMKYRWLAKLTNCVFCVHTYIHSIFLDIYILYTYILVVLFFKKTWKNLHNYLRIDTKLQRKELSKISIERKSDNNNIRSKYVQNIVIGYVQIFLFVIKNLGIACRFSLRNTNQY